ncbi:hypothetical protein [Actinoplanes sp. NBRC 103695]|uniref:hypothetical protein n=1 Tax=Actinoplanes sp. NBRC 103695 TaxID=3032202 RepID=UPI0024A13D6B|nr:hypothetical protein [Actinoplanes sp. NBRC 103695]GLY97868.1 hypothetical protein Acsp02_51220 [Actinoplanes sp. NBRC 103695]
MKQRELSEMLTEAKAGPPPARFTVDDAVAAGRRLQTRRRAAWSGATVAAAVVAVATVVSVPRLMAGPPTAPPAPPAASQAAAGAPLTYPAKPWQYAFESYQVGEFHVNDPFLVTADFQQATVRIGNDVDVYATDPSDTTPRTEPADNLLLTVYKPGRYSPKQFDGGEQVSVGGKPGLFKERTFIDGDTSMVDEHRGLAWQYADDAWAVLNTYQSDDAKKAGKDALMRVAAGLHGVPAYPAKVAIKVGEVPAGYRLAQGGRGPGYPNGGASESYRTSLLYVKDKPKTTAKLTDAVPDDEQVGREIRINVFPGAHAMKADPPAGAEQEPYCNPGNDSLCYRKSPGGTFQVEIIGSGDTSSAALKTILASIKFAGSDKPATWFPLTP